MYVYQALIEARQDTAVPCSQLKQTFDELCRENKVAEQFEVCNKRINNNNNSNNSTK